MPNISKAAVRKCSLVLQNISGKEHFWTIEQQSYSQAPKLRHFKCLKHHLGAASDISLETLLLALNIGSWDKGLFRRYNHVL